MNNEKAYEKHLASQLEKLEAPASAETHWPAMKALLDRELPEGAVGFRWVYLLLLLIVFTGAGWYFWPSSTINKVKTDLPGQTAASGTPSTEKTIPAAGTNKEAQEASVLQEQRAVAVVSPENITKAEATRNAVTEENKTVTSSTVKTVSTAKSTPELTRKLEGSRNVTSEQAGLKFSNRKKISSIAPINNSAELLMDPATTDAEAVTPIGTDPATAALTALETMPVPDSMNTAYGEKLMRYRPFRSRFPEETERTKALRNRSVGTGDNKNFVFGLTLPLTVAISDQKTSAFNVGGGSNKLSDYLPSPHVQYHINDKSFLQSEIQFYAPQYIRPALLYQQTQPNAAGSGNNLYKTRSVYTEKLYYFNLPVSGYYSPFKNFYLGTGMQYSRLLSGIAHIQETTGPSLNPGSATLVVNDYFTRFRRDTLSAALNNNEFRVLLDANYYWKKFTMGFRYNQALGNYIGLQVNGFNPYYTDRNKSFLFYLRYNLWENHKSPRPAMAYKPQ